MVAGDTVYVAGTIGIDPETGAPPADPVAEARLALDGMKAKLELAEGSFEQLAETQINGRQIRNLSRLARILYPGRRVTLEQMRDVLKYGCI